MAFSVPPLCKCECKQQQQQQQQQQRQQTALAADGGIKLVLAVMRRHGLAVAIQEYGVGLLDTMLVVGQESPHAKEFRREFADEEGISTVLAAMMIHPDHAAIQSSGCDVLIKMVLPDSPNRFDLLLLLEDDPEVVAACARYKRCLVEETDAMAILEAALERFPTHRYLQHRGEVLLRALRAPSQARTRVVVEAAREAVHSHSSRLLSSTASLLASASRG